MQIFLGLMRVPTTDSLRPRQTIGSASAAAAVSDGDAAGPATAINRDKLIDNMERLPDFSAY
jgi:hypothetical protein